MTVKKNNVQVILSKEDFDIFEKAHEILSMVVEESEKAEENNVDINIVDENGDEIKSDDISSAYWSLRGILWE